MEYENQNGGKDNERKNKRNSKDSNMVSSISRHDADNRIWSIGGTKMSTKANKKKYGVTIVDGSSGYCVTRYYNNIKEAKEMARLYSGILLTLREDKA